MSNFQKLQVQILYIPEYLIKYGLIFINTQQIHE